MKTLRLDNEQCLDVRFGLMLAMDHAEAMAATAFKYSTVEPEDRFMRGLYSRRDMLSNLADLKRIHELRAKLSSPPRRRR